MSATLSQPAQLPFLIGSPTVLEGPPRERWLGRLHSSRLRLRAAWLPAAEENAIRVIDGVVGLLLLLRFLRDRAAEDFPSPKELFPANQDMTLQELCQLLRGAVSSPLLKSVLDPQSFDGQIAMPQPVLQFALDTQLGWMHGPLPLTAFGEFHQLCLAERRGNGLPGGQRRSRGVHYTPVSLVDYLTNRALGQVALGAGRTRSDLRVLDPSCGCGTFLLAAWNYLQQAAGPSLQDKLNILGASIFGIDIDAEAVEWTRRVLLLAAWETARGQEGDTSLRVPDLRYNIVAADFLVGPREAGDPWNHFDAILGGPPFVRLHQMLQADPARLARYRQEFLTARSGQFDLYMLFFEKAIRCLRDGGCLGWSTSSTFLRTTSGRSLRSLIGGSCTMHELVEFEDANLYPDAVTQIALVLLEKGRREAPCRHVWVGGNQDLRYKLSSLQSEPSSLLPEVKVNMLAGPTFRRPDWSFGTERECHRVARLEKTGSPLGRLPITMAQGIVTGADSVFLFRRVAASREGEVLVQSRKTGRHHLLESALLQPLIRNRDIRGFRSAYPRTICLVPYDATGRLLSETILQAQYPMVHQYLLANREVLAKRRGVKGAWYAFRSPVSLHLDSRPKVLMGLICSGGDFTLDVDGGLLAHSSVLQLVPDPQRIDPYFLLGILNSQVFWFFVRQKMPTMGEKRHVLRRGTLRTISTCCRRFKPLSRAANCRFRASAAQRKGSLRRASSTSRRDRTPDGRALRT